MRLGIPICGHAVHSAAATKLSADRRAARPSHAHLASAHDVAAAAAAAHKAHADPAGQPPSCPPRAMLLLHGLMVDLRRNERRRGHPQTTAREIRPNERTPRAVSVSASTRPFVCGGSTAQVLRTLMMPMSSPFGAHCELCYAQTACMHCCSKCAVLRQEVVTELRW